MACPSDGWCSHFRLLITGNASFPSVRAGTTIAAIVTALVIASAALAQKTSIESADRFTGSWKLNPAHSRLRKGEHYVSYTRTYAHDGTKVRVSWKIDYGHGKQDNGDYVANCDSTEEPIAAGIRLRCRKVNESTVEGEVIDSDPAHRYYRRNVAPDRRKLTLTWYADSKRKTVSERLVFDRSQ